MRKKLRVDIRSALPNVPNATDRCVQRLIETIQAKRGVGSAHLIEADTEGPDRVCIHFDPQQISLGELRDFVRRSGGEVDRRFGHLLVRTNVDSPASAKSWSRRLEGAKGFLEVEVGADGAARIEFDRDQIDEANALKALRDAGLAPMPVLAGSEASARKFPEEGEVEGREHRNDHEHGGMLGERAELIFALFCGVLLAIGWGLETFSELNEWIPRGFYFAAYFFGGFFTVREAIEHLLARRFEIDFLMIVAAVGAGALGEWAEGALLLFLFSLGHSLEHYAMGRARRAIEALAELAPKTATVLRDGSSSEIPVENIDVGDVLLVRPNERIPADGVVIKGNSSVDQSPVTGESVPVDKSPIADVDRGAESKVDPAHTVFAGTINGSGALEVRATKRAQDTTLSKVVQMVAEAETQKSPTQRFTDRFERIFVPTVLSLVIVLLFAWVVLDEPFSASFYRAMAVLVAASPCALAIATPSAVLSAVARAGRGGVLVKGGGPLENLGRLRSIAFDKTGTLTEGKPRLIDVVPFKGADEGELLTVATAVERLSDHPLASAVVRGAEERLNGASISQANDLRSITGRGVSAVIDGETVHIGKDALFSEVPGSPLPPELRESTDGLKREGRTTMIVRKGDRYLGVLGLMDTPRAPAAAVIATLKRLGIERMIMISGDNQQVATAVAKQVGLDEARGDLMPEDKVETIKALRAEGGVAMVGDGVNDAPAMANATVGIAMGAAGSDVALETADVALMADDLNHLPFAVGLSRRTSRIIRQNLWMSLGMVAFLIPATLIGLRIGPAVALHEGSTLIVVFNALRLLAYRPPRID